MNYRNIQRHISDWAKLLEYLHLRTGRELLLLPHTCRPGKGDDRYWLTQLYQECSSRLPITQIDEPWTTYEIQKTVSRSSFIIASRMHLGLTAIKCGVPFIALAYSHKYQQLIPSTFQEIQPVVTLSEIRGGCLFPVIQERFDLLWRDRQIFRDAIISYAHEAYTRAEENIHLIREVACSSQKGVLKNG